MDVASPASLLGGLSPAAFMRRHWQKKPLLVRAAWPGVRAPLPAPSMFALVANEAVESRLVVRQGDAWRVRRGPMPRRALPPRTRPGWTLLVQGLDLHVEAARRMLECFRFVPDARLDDLMMSWASPGGGVGPHVDAYDVFLIQVHGRRRWRVSPPGDAAFVEGLPLKILRRFEPVHDWVLEPGDLLYLPPMWGHDGVAEGGECMTCSVGFRVPTRGELARELLERMADAAADVLRRPEALYTDPRQPATTTPARIPEGLAGFARQAVAELLARPDRLASALGEVLSEPKPQVWFDAGAAVPDARAGVVLDARTRMLYDEHHIYINGEAYRADGRDAELLRVLADSRRLEAGARARLGREARACLEQWAEAGWLRAEEETR